MPDAMTELLQQEMQCERLLDCFHGLSELDKEVFRLLVEADDAITVDEIADAMQRTLDEFYAKMGYLIGEFREKYGDVDADTDGSGDTNGESGEPEGPLTVE